MRMKQLVRLVRQRLTEELLVELLDRRVVVGLPQRHALVGIADDNFVIAFRLRGQFPFDAGGERGAAPTSQARLLDAVHDLLGRHLSERLAQSLIALEFRLNPKKAHTGRKEYVDNADQMGYISIETESQLH